MDKREVDLYTVLAVTHHVPGPAAPYRALLTYLSGQELPGPFHVIGVTEPCAQWLLEQHPRLRDVPQPPDFHEDARAIDAWVTSIRERLGSTTLTVSPLPLEQQHAIPDHIERMRRARHR